MRIALATSDRATEPDRDADFLLPALRRMGAEAELVAWTSPSAVWDGYDLVMLSSTWDYHERVEEFRAWLAATDRLTRLRNPRRTVAWNLDKRYLRKLAEAGIPTIPTLFTDEHRDPALLAEISARGWEQVVLKPVVDLGAMQLARVVASDAPLILERMPRPAMCQPYLRSLESEGELSLVYLGDELSHSLRKRPAAGDFRVQPMYGGTHERIEAPARAVEIAEAALALAPGKPLYARADLVYGDDGSLRLIELELIEPALYLDVAPEQAVPFARALLAAAAGGKR